MQNILEEALYQWSCGKISAKAIQKLFKKHGWSINLRQRDFGNNIEAINPQGEYVWLGC